LPYIDKMMMVKNPVAKKGASGMIMANADRPYDARRGVTSSEMSKRQSMLRDIPRGQWRQKDRNLAPEVSRKLENAFIAGELRFGMWDNGLFRDFDLAKMQEIPGFRELQRVKEVTEDGPLSIPV